MLLETTIILCQMIRDISVRPTKITGPVKVDHLRRWSQICWSDQTKMVCSIFISNRNSGIVGLNGKRPVYNNEVTITQGMTVMSFQHRTPILHTFQPHANFLSRHSWSFLKPFFRTHVKHTNSPLF